MSTGPTLDEARSTPQAKSPPLPADLFVPDVLASLQKTPNLIVEAAPGAGKTTRLPPALLSLVKGKVLVLEPRRLAARLAARRVASERGERLGDTVGYTVRFDQVSGPATRLLFITEGILTRRLLSDPDLRDVDAVVLDEFHERHLDTDLALALLRELQARRPELLLLVMSATLRTGPVAAFLGDAPVLQAGGRAYPLTITHLPYSPKPLEAQVANAVTRLAREGPLGHTLIFLPGIAEIRRAMRACEQIALDHGLLSVPLHGDLSPEEQDRAVEPSRRPKLIFSTNVAESSITVDGVTAVIDSGLARVASHSPWTGLETLTIARISQASARQRAGRAGRTAPGRVLRLYPEEDLSQRPAQETPEILRSDLTPLALTIRSLGYSTIDHLRWLDPPPEQAVRHAEDLLDRLAADRKLAARMAKLPLPPRIARMVLDAADRNLLQQGLRAAALLSCGQRLAQVDLLEALEQPLAPEAIRELASLQRVLGGADKNQTTADEALLRALLTGFPDRVARLRAGRQLLLSSGGSAELAGTPPGYSFMVVLDAELRPDRGLPIVRVTSRVEPEWLLDLFPERMRETVDIVWNQADERAERVTTLRYDELTIQEWREPASGDPRTAKLLAAKACEAGLARFVEEDALNGLLRRIAFVRRPAPDVTAALERLSGGLSSFAELEKAGSQLLPLLESDLDLEHLRTWAPAKIRLASGREVKVHYEQDQPPWIASRLQDFFGMQETPRVGPDRTPVVAHLLAPNQRAVQTTNDLAGFWKRLYPQVRQELARRYPRHSWPEKPI